MTDIISKLFIVTTAAKSTLGLGLANFKEGFVKEKCEFNIKVQSLWQNMRRVGTWIEETTEGNILKILWYSCRDRYAYKCIYKCRYSYICRDRDLGPYWVEEFLNNFYIQRDI